MTDMLSPMRCRRLALAALALAVVAAACSDDADPETRSHPPGTFADDGPVRLPTDDAPTNPRIDMRAIRRSEQPPKEVVLDQVHSLASLNRRLEEMDTETPFEVLGAPMTATTDQLQAAFAKQLFIYHPDRLRGRVSEDVARACAQVCRKLQEARNQLATEADLQHYRELTMAGSSARGRAEASTAAASRLEEAERCIRRRDFVVAEAHVLAAISADGERPSYQGLLGWCRAQAIPIREGRGIDHRYDAMLELLRNAVRAEPNAAQIRYYFGQVLLRSRRTDAAMKQFRLVLELQPQNVGAARELRLHEMRTRRKTSGGFLERVWRGGAHR